MTKTLWIGGTSSLTRTYINAYGHEGLVLTGIEVQPPAWVPKGVPYHSLDFRKPVQDDASALFENISSIIVGLRAPLVTGSGDHERLLVGLESVLQAAAAQKEEATTIRYVIHISSVAVVNHLQTQVGVNEATPTPPLESYQGSYDRFKRLSEDLIDASGLKNVVHLRVSAIFSDSYNCIQCGALSLQSRLCPSTMPLRIDCNSGRNVATAIRLLQQGADREEKLAPVYYYTRPLKESVYSYGDYLQFYIQAYDYPYRIMIPFVLVTYFTMLLNWLVWRTGLHRISGTAVSIDYLLQVAFREHTFDCSLFQRDFPEITNQEETIFECFVRRRLYLERT